MHRKIAKNTPYFRDKIKPSSDHDLPFPPPDVNECVQSSKPCDPSYVCINTVGAFECRCPKGTMEKAGACIPKKSFAGTVRAKVLNYTQELQDKSSTEYKEAERRAVQEVSASAYDVGRHH